MHSLENSMKQKHLFFTIDFPPLRGGVATYISHICKNTDPEKIIVLAQQHQESEKFDSKQKYKIIRKNFSPNWKDGFKIIKSLLEKTYINHIHINHVIPLGYIALLFKLYKRIPYTVYLHGLDVKSAQRKFHKKFLMKIILRNAKNVIVNSRHTESLIMKVIPTVKPKIKIVFPCPHEDLQEYPKDQEIVNKYKDNKVLLTVARLVKRKGHERVLACIPELTKKFPHLKYIIIGTGKYKEKLESLCKKLSIEKYVDFLDDVPQKLLPTYYNLCDIFVMPNQMLKNDVEGFGITFLEANLFKKPVVGGNNGGVSEAIVHNETGYLINDYSEKQLYDVLFKLLSSPDLCHRIGKNGYKRVITDFTWKKQILKLQL